MSIISALITAASHLGAKERLVFYNYAIERATFSFPFFEGHVLIEALDSGCCLYVLDNSCLWVEILGGDISVKLEGISQFNRGEKIFALEEFSSLLEKLKKSSPGGFLPYAVNKACAELQIFALRLELGIESSS